LTWSIVATGDDEGALNFVNTIYCSEYTRWRLRLRSEDAGVEKEHEEEEEEEEEEARGDVNG
jgi:hypothetical protein